MCGNNIRRNARWLVRGCWRFSAFTTTAYPSRVLRPTADELQKCQCIDFNEHVFGSAVERRSARYASEDARGYWLAANMPLGAQRPRDNDFLTLRKKHHANQQ
jgi:hypothetical protein